MLRDCLLALFFASAASGQGFDPKLSTGLYGDVRAVPRDTARPEQSRAQVGQLVFHALGQLDDHWSMLAEAVLEYSDDKHETSVDLERFFMTYAVDDHWSLGLGKRHTPLGYWNNAYHHGAIFQPTIARPSLTQFEDDGGLQPAHDTGLWLTARNLGPARVGFEAMVSNGQTGNQEHDANANKAVTVHLETGLGGGAVLGASYRQDLLAANASLNGREGTVPLDLNLVFHGADFRVVHPPFLFLSEYLHVRERDAQGTAGDWVWFAYAGWTRGAWTPYGLYQRQRIDPESRVYGGGFAGSGWNALAGLRYDFANPVNVKLELSHGRPVQDKVQLAVAFGF